MPFDSESRNDEIAVNAPLPEEPADVSGENGHGWITEAAFFKVSPGARQVRQRQEVKMNQLSLIFQWGISAENTLICTVSTVVDF